MCEGNAGNIANLYYLVLSALEAIDMRLLYSSIPPLTVSAEQAQFANTFEEQAAQADAIEIAVGYISRFALEELDRIAVNNGIHHICLNMGMYFIEGMPESTYRSVLRLNAKWREMGIGEIRVVQVFKYHGKAYCFYREGVPISAIIGSANLGVLRLDASNLRQYELSAITEAPNEALEIATHIEALKSSRISSNIADVRIRLLREQNVSLAGIDTVEPVGQSEVQALMRHRTDISFTLPLKVPKYAERFMDDGKHFTKSNINVCYAKPRYARKARDWYEIQMTVGKEITTLPGYPEKNKTFFAITDDGYRFKAHTTSDGNKQFNAVGDELLIGRWLKGRLAAAGLVTPINNTMKDTDRRGMITHEMLSEYGCDSLVLCKTTQTMMDDDGNVYDAWLLSMESESSY